MGRLLADPHPLVVIVLDTHAWLWWLAEPEKLSSPARNAIDQADGIGIATISCWELAMLTEAGRIAIDRPVGAWVQQALVDVRTAALPLTGSIAVRAALLGREGFVGDPADRIIYTTSRHLGASLVTRDEELRRFDPRGTIW